MQTACVFPGQGSQYVGMGRELFQNFSAAKSVFQEVDDALSQHLSKLMFEGPLELLTATENTQPALMAVSLAVLRVLEQEAQFLIPTHARFVAGHSLGEYTALAAVGSLTLRDTAQLLRVRGKAIQSAVPAGAGGMVALLGVNMTEAEAIAQEAAQGEVCQVANDNAPGQIVLSGHKTALVRAAAVAEAKGKRAITLAVSAPFHSMLMNPAAEVMAGALAETSIQEPSLPLIANVTAAPVKSPQLIRGLLVQQVAGMVRWHESIVCLKAQGIERILEIGPGTVLSGLTKRIDKTLQSVSLQEPEDIKRFLSTL